jgi:hypothetical protein
MSIKSGAVKKMGLTDLMTQPAKLRKPAWRERLRLGWMWAVFAAVVSVPSIRGQPIEVDSDADGLSDALEQRLLEQFVPTFEIGAHDCSVRPAEFSRNVQLATVQAEDGTIYGQAFPVRAVGSGREVELHFYQLWRRDCGEHGHPLDAEHVAVLVRASGDEWKALYWYAAAHEQTVCDVSQIARASTLRAETKGARVWISPDKHASYLDRRLCSAGCGADVCEQMVPLATKRVVNLGEVGHLMDGSEFVGSSGWPLAQKMQQSNFPAEPVARLERLPETEIAWFRPGRHPMQGVIGISSTTEGAIGKGASETGSSLDVAGDSASDAISVAGDSTGNALVTSYRKTKRALGKAGRGVGGAIGLQGEPKK